MSLRKRNRILSLILVPALTLGILSMGMSPFGDEPDEQHDGSAQEIAMDAGPETDEQVLEMPEGSVIDEQDAADSESDDGNDIPSIGADDELLLNEGHSEAIHQSSMQSLSSASNGFSLTPEISADGLVGGFYYHATDNNVFYFIFDAATYAEAYNGGDSDIVMHFAFSGSNIHNFTWQWGSPAERHLKFTINSMDFDAIIHGYDFDYFSFDIVRISDGGLILSSKDLVDDNIFQSSLFIAAGTATTTGLRYSTAHSRVPLDHHTSVDGNAFTERLLRLHYVDAGGSVQKAPFIPDGTAVTFVPNAGTAADAITLERINSAEWNIRFNRPGSGMLEAVIGGTVYSMTVTSTMLTSGFSTESTLTEQSITRTFTYTPGSRTFYYIDDFLFNSSFYSNHVVTYNSPGADISCEWAGPAGGRYLKFTINSMTSLTTEFELDIEFLNPGIFLGDPPFIDNRQMLLTIQNATAHSGPTTPASGQLLASQDLTSQPSMTSITGWLHHSLLNMYFYFIEAGSSSTNDAKLLPAGTEVTFIPNSGTAPDAVIIETMGGDNPESVELTFRKLGSGRLEATVGGIKYSMPVEIVLPDLGFSSEQTLTENSIISGGLDYTPSNNVFYFVFRNQSDFDRVYNNGNSKVDIRLEGFDYNTGSAAHLLDDFDISWQWGPQSSRYIKFTINSLPGIDNISSVVMLFDITHNGNLLLSSAFYIRVLYRSHHPSVPPAAPPSVPPAAPPSVPPAAPPSVPPAVPVPVATVTGTAQTVPQTLIPVTGGGSTVPVPVAVNEDTRSARLLLDSRTAETLIADAHALAAQQGEDAVPTAVFNLSSLSSVTAAQLTSNALGMIADAGLAIDVVLPQGTVSLDSDALISAVEQAAGEDLTILLDKQPHTELTAAQREAIDAGDMVFSIKITAGDTAITNFNGTLTITVPYAGALPVAVWYLNERGELEKLDCEYDEISGSVTFTTNHLSLYVVGNDRDAAAPAENENDSAVNADERGNEESPAEPALPVISTITPGQDDTESNFSPAVLIISIIAIVTVIGIALAIIIRRKRQV